jgi:membrane protein
VFLFRYPVLLMQKLREVRAVQTASSLAFTSLLAIVPMLTVSIIVTDKVGVFSPVSAGVRQFLIREVLPDRAGRVITNYVVQFSQKAAGLTVLGTALLVLTALMLLQTIDKTFNGIWHVTAPRPWFVRLPAYVLALMLGPLLFGLGAYVTSMLVSASLGFVNEPRWVAKLSYQVASATLLSALFAYVFHVVPNKALNSWHSVVGGIVAGVGIVLIQRLFGLYLSRLPNFTLVYGTFSVLPIFLIWLHATWLVVLFGATVAASLHEYPGKRSARKA